MIRATPLILAALAAAPAAAQTQPTPTVEAAQQALDGELSGPHPEITVTHARDDVKKTSLLVRTIGTSRTLRRCETEFTTPVEKLNGNAKSERTWRIAWGSLAAVRFEDARKLELVAKKPDGVRVFLGFSDDETASDFAEGIEFLRRNCAG